jgi:hypothetical protein
VRLKNLLKKSTYLREWITIDYMKNNTLQLNINAQIQVFPGITLSFCVFHHSTPAHQFALWKTTILESYETCYILNESTRIFALIIPAQLVQSPSSCHLLKSSKHLHGAHDSVPIGILVHFV